MDGWHRVEGAGIAVWAQGAAAVARKVLAGAAPADWRCGGTWFVGVDALPTDAAGALPGGPPLPAGLCPRALPLHRAQLSVTRPGYPQQGPEDSASAHRFRVRRDAAHLDGLLPIGAKRRRMIREPHAFVLGIGLGAADAGAAPLVVWSGSHRLMRAALAHALAPYPPDTWANVDVTDAYQAARREVFEICPRVIVPLAAGQAVVLHRHLLHGVAPWADGAMADPMGRATAYFRPLLDSVSDWIADDP